MFRPAVGFVAQKCKRYVTLEGADTSSSGEKRPRQSPSYEEAQQDGTIVLVGSSDLASNDQSALGVFLNEANIPLEGEVPAVRPPNVEEVRMSAPSGVVIAPASLPRLTAAGPSKKRLLDWVIVNTYVPPLERVGLRWIWRLRILKTC